MGSNKNTKYDVCVRYRTDANVNNANLGELSGKINFATDNRSEYEQGNSPSDSLFILKFA